MHTVTVVRIALQRMEEKRLIAIVEEKKGENKGLRAGKEEGRMPRELVGLSAKTSSGKKFCFAFSLEGCPGGRDCLKGEHRCMKPGCESTSHGARDHK